MNTDYQKALAAAREAAAQYQSFRADWNAHAATQKLIDLLAAIDAQQPVAWRYTADDGYSSFQVSAPSVLIRYRYKDWTPLYAAPPAPEQRSCETATCAVPEGYAMVPVEPTEKMLEEGGMWTDAYAIWEAMLAAAQAKEGKP